MSESQSNWYYFCTIGCGFCKKADPVVQEINKEKNDPELEILRLDLADGDNEKLAKELKEKYNVQCGTPWFINAETGKGFCGYREKDMIEKWLNGEDIPAPPRPKSQMPRPPFHGAKKGEENNWKVEYENWAEENSHLPNLKTADEILAMPRPKTQPPPPPRPDSSDKEKNEWKIKYDTWAKDNGHLPNLIDSQKILDRMKLQQQQQPPTQQMGNQPFDQRLRSVEDKLNRLMQHLGVK